MIVDFGIDVSAVALGDQGGGDLVIGFRPTANLETFGCDWTSVLAAAIFALGQRQSHEETWEAAKSLGFEGFCHRT